MALPQSNALPTAPEERNFAEYFNGSSDMVSVKDTENDTAKPGRHRVVITARTATGAVRDMTVIVVIPGVQQLH